MSLSRSPTTVIPRPPPSLGHAPQGHAWPRRPDHPPPSRRHAAKRMPLRRRGTGFLVVGAALFVVADLALGAVHHGTIQQADDTALVGVNRQNGMQEQAGMLAVAAIAEAVLAGLVGRKIQLGRV